MSQVKYYQIKGIGAHEELVRVIIQWLSSKIQTSVMLELLEKQ
jgi:hypothetical protein